MAYQVIPLRCGTMAEARGCADARAGTEGQAKEALARVRMIRRDGAVLNGLSTAPVGRRFREVAVWLRPACPTDCRLIWEWANEPTVRAASFATEVIRWEAHQHWFATRLAHPSCAFFIALKGAGIPIGQVRCDVKGSVAVISISLDPHFRAIGYGTSVIRKGCLELFGRGQVDTIQAFIRRGNAASHKAFEKAGFKKVEDTIVRSHPASLLVLRK